MKKSFMSVSMLVVSISVVLVFLCGFSVANAQTTSRKFVYDKKENVETVYTLDKSGKFLTPTLRYDLKRDDSGNLLEKKAYRWNAESREWTSYYQMIFSEDGVNSVIEYAMWNKDSQDFTLNQQKAVYNKNTQEDIIAYISYHWDPSLNDWNLDEQIIFQNYLAIRASH